MAAAPRKLPSGKWRAERRHNGALRFLGTFRYKYEAENAIRVDEESVGVNPVGGRPRAGIPTTTKVSFRVTPAELDAIREMAAAAGQPVADFCRTRALLNL